MNPETRKRENEKMRFSAHVRACAQGKIVIATNLHRTVYCANFAAGSHGLHSTAELSAVIVRSDGGGKRQ